MGFHLVEGDNGPGRIVTGQAFLDLRNDRPLEAAIFLPICEMGAFLSKEIFFAHQGGKKAGTPFIDRM